MRRCFARLLFAAVACFMATFDVAAYDGGKVFYQFNASNGLADNSAQTIMCTKTGRMVISTIGHINFYDGDRFTHIDPTTGNVFPLPKYNGHYRMMFDRHHHLWLKDKLVVSCVDLGTESFIDDVGGVFRELGMKQRVDDLFGDTNGGLWMLSGTKLYGDDGGKAVALGKVDAELQDVDANEEGRLLLFYSDGKVKVYDRASGRVLYEDAMLKGADTANYVRSSVIMREGNSYYQIRNGSQGALLLCYHADTRQWERMMDMPYHLNNMTLKDSVLYVASEYGYWEYHLATKEKYHVETLTLSKGRTLQTDVNAVCFDRQGGLWIGTERRGLLYAKPTKSPFKLLALDDPQAAPLKRLLDQRVRETRNNTGRRVNCTYRDSRGWLWTGTYMGLELMMPNQKTKHLLGRKDGLMNEMIHSIIEDDNHHLWVGTSYGISYLSVDSGKLKRVETFTTYDGVPDETFVNGAAIKLDDGTIVMQMLDHIICFDPNVFFDGEVLHVPLYPKLVRLLVNGSNMKAGQDMDGRVILRKTISRIRELTVDYDQNSLSLTFSALNYFRPIQTYYRFRVKGVINDWQLLSYNNSNGLVDKAGLLHLPLPGLHPGKYVIEVQASMLPDYWPVEPLTWTINVEQPWWRSTGIYILMLIALVALALANIYYFFRNTRMRMLVNNEEKDIIKRIKYYAQRCDYLTGEVLTPYSYVSGALRDSKDETNQRFMEAMLKIVPFILQAKDADITMQQLAQVAGIGTDALHEMLTDNLYKSPRQLARKLRLQQVAELLPNTDMTVEEIAERFHFVSPNYLIASFYHEYRMTPMAYRNSKAR